jgi:hypothetical protein
LHARGDAEAEAKRHVLQALEEAPRFREAQRLLLELEKNPPPSQTETPRPAERRVAAIGGTLRDYRQSARSEAPRSLTP